MKKLLSKKFVGVFAVIAAALVIGLGLSFGFTPVRASYIQTDLTNLNASNLTSGTTVVARGGTGAATLTANQVLVGNGTSAVTATGLFSNGSVPITGAKFVNLTLQNTAGTGNQDLKDASTGSAYVVPSGKIFIHHHGSYYNGNASTANFQFELKRSSTYYKLLSTQSPATGTLSTNFIPIGTFIFIAGDSVAFTSSHNAANVWMSGVECDDTASIKTASILSLSNGDNTLYTCPANKSAVIIPTSLLASPSGNGAVYVYNGSGGSRNYKINVVSSGGAISTSNLVVPATAVADTANGTLTFSASLGAGDFININTNAGTATQTAWVTVIEY